MPKVTNAFDTYSAKGNREDLANTIYNIAPYDTPIMSAIQRRSISNVVFDWQTETLPAVNLSNAEVEGFELSRAAATATTRQSNTAQISYRDATVTGSQENANAAGKGAGEMAHQMALASKALKRDMESILSQNQARVSGAAATARKTRALEHWISTNASRGAGGAAAVSETAAMTDGTQRALTEPLLKTVLQSAYTNGAEPTLMVVGPFNKQTVSGFVGRSSARQNIDATRVEASVTVYASDFGEIRVVPSRWVRARTALLLDPEYARVSFYRNFQTKDIAQIGDAETKMVLAEWGLQVDNEAAHAAIFDLTTS